MCTMVFMHSAPANSEKDSSRSKGEEIDSNSWKEQWQITERARGTLNTTVAFLEDAAGHSIWV